MEKYTIQKKNNIKYKQCKRCKGTYSPYNYTTGCCDSCENDMYKLATQGE